MKPESFKWLTRRDKAVLSLLYFHRYATTSQIDEIFFRYASDGSENTCSKIVARRRLKKLRDNNMIKSYYRSDNDDMLHTISEDGVYVVAAIRGTSYRNLYFTSKQDMLSYGLAEHSILLNDVYISLLKEIRTTGKGEIVTFQAEQLNEQNFTIGDQAYKLRPDIFFIYKPDKESDRVRMFYIEVDNSTENTTRFREKIEAYERFYNTKIFQGQYSGMFPHVVTVCHTQKRIDRLRLVTNTKLRWYYVLFDNVADILRD